MANLISNTVAHISNLLKGLQVKRFLAVVLVGFLLLTTNAAPEHGSNKALTNKIDELVHNDDSQRPKTTGDWNKEARETEDAPGERLQRIGKQTGEALKDFGSVYPDTAERTVNADQ